MHSTPVPERFRPLLSATAELAERFTKADRTLYLVGGSVRDALYPMGAGAAAEQDFDLTTNARPDEIEMGLTPEYYPLVTDKVPSRTRSGPASAADRRHPSGGRAGKVRDLHRDRRRRPGREPGRLVGPEDR